MRRNHRPAASACRKKTRRGNSYPTRKAAEGAAVGMSARTGGAIVAFRCPTCGLWHIGNSRGT